MTSIPALPPLNGVDASWLDESERRVLRQAFVREIAELRANLVI